MSHPPALGLLTLLVLVMSPHPVSPQPDSGPLGRGDVAWERRATAGGEPDPRAVEEAVAAYQEAVGDHPDDLEARWKLLRALHFQGEYLSRGEEGRREVFTRARDRAEEALDRVAGRLGGREAMDALEPEERAEALRGGGGAGQDLEEVFFWSAVAWGQWGDTAGRLKAARQGIAGRLRDLVGTVLALDETHAGAHRFLGRLHAVAPKIPFFTGWVDRDLALEHLRRAVELEPEDPEGELFLAEAILDHRRQRRAEALEILRRLAGREPRPELRVEDTRTLATARRRLAEEEGGKVENVIHSRKTRLEELLPQTERVEIAGASHIMHEDNPPAYNEAVRSFLAAHGSRAAVRTPVDSKGVTRCE